jgi:acetyl esterase/lipase
MLRPFIARAAAVAIAASVTMAAAAPATAAPPTAAAFGRLPAVSSMVLSPDGTHIAGVVSTSGEDSYVAVWRTDAPGEPPKLTPSGRGQQVMWVDFLKNDRLEVTVRQLFDTTLTGGRYRSHLLRPLITSLDGSKVLPLLPPARGSEMTEYLDAIDPPGVVDHLPQDPQHVLIQDSGPSGRDIYKVNVYTGRAAKETLAAGGKFGGEQVDLAGEIRARQELNYDNGKVYIAQWIKNPANGRWEEHFRWYAKDREPMSIVGFAQDPNIAFLVTNKGRDKAAIYEYSIKDRKILEPLFEHKLFDAVSLVRSQGVKDRGRILGFVYAAETNKIYWVDEKLAAADKAAREALGVTTEVVNWTDPATGEQARIAVPKGFDTQIIGVSDDLSVVLVEKSGPKQPPEYYLLKGGKLSLLGKSRPNLDTDALGDGRLVQYKARDGLIIPAFLTTPPKSVYGDGPYPAILVPHGGPWARDNLDWDPSGWTQYFAARGYAVLQPQFRGSEGWGQKLWRAGDAEWGQKMQDDLDDGAKWLISQRIAAPDRIAMHGYSYGGYAAYAAAVRPNGLYQCSIAGAGVARIGDFERLTYEERFVREFQNPTIKGLDPMAKVSDISIPLFIYHGDRDQTVPLKQSIEIAGKLKGAGKPYKYVEIPDMGHGFVTWGAKDAEFVLETDEGWLKNDCGPGGL